MERERKMEMKREGNKRVELRKKRKYKAPILS